MVNYNNSMKTKPCPKCGSRNLIGAEECLNCGHVFEPEKKFDPIEFEKRAVDVFSFNGWEVKRPSPSSKTSYDLELSFNGEFYGYVELIFNPNLERIKNALIRTKELFNNSDCKVFIITDLNLYYVSYFKEEFEKTFVTPSPYAGRLLVEDVKKSLAEYEESNKQ